MPNTVNMPVKDNTDSPDIGHMTIFCHDDTLTERATY